MKCKYCGGEYVNQHVGCFVKMMATKKGAKELAEILEQVVMTAHCLADNNEERLMIYRAAVRYGEVLTAKLRGQVVTS